MLKLDQYPSGMSEDVKKNSNKSYSINSLVWAFLILAIGIILGMLWHRFLDSDISNLLSLPPDRKEDTARKLINPLLDCEFAENSFAELRPFQKDVEDFVGKLNNPDNGIDLLALYFRDLNNGPWLGINEKTDFSPASLLKIPIMITYFKEAEADPSILNKTIVFRDDGNIPATEQTVVPEETIKIGQSYAVNDLIYRMIVYSDNLAQHLLVANINLAALKEVFSDFDLEMPDQNQKVQVNVQEYSRFFRVLFNASYLSKEHSEKALELLSQSKFKDGLVAGVPRSVTVAHKFGERQLSGDSEKQFHDCGIVYYPGHPYLICIMSRGPDSAKLIGTIRDVSSFIYNKMDSQFGK